jgi:hypothetical protein
MKEYFSVSYEQKKKDKLNEINEIYNKLISTYTSETNTLKKAEAGNDIKQYNLQIMNELDNYLDLIESQMTILDNKQNELIALENNNINTNLSSIDYTNDISTLDKQIKKYKTINTVLITISILLIILFIVLLNFSF